MSPAVALVAAHCDIVDRLKAVPPSARVRGLYFRHLQQGVARAGRLELYRELFPTDSWSTMKFYALGDYLVRLACAGALMKSPERVHEGMFELGKGNALAFANSLLGRAMLRLLARDPVRITEQGLSARRQSTQYGHWDLIRHSPTCVEMVYEEEYVWIESNIAGAAVGTFEACGLSPQIETRLKDRFNGSTVIRW